VTELIEAMAIWMGDKKGCDGRLGRRFVAESTVYIGSPPRLQSHLPDYNS